MQGYGPGNLVQMIELQRWNISRGIRSHNTKLSTSELMAAIEAEPFDRRIAAVLAGVLLEATLDKLALQYKCRFFPRSQDNVYTLGPLLDGTSKLFKKLNLIRSSVDESGNISLPLNPKKNLTLEERHTELMESTYVRNQVGAHYSFHGMEMSDVEVAHFATLTSKFVNSLICSECGQIPSKPAPMGHKCSCSEDRALFMISG